MTDARPNAGLAHRIGVDIGGTFTDFTVLRDDGSVRLWKEPSTPAEPSRAIMAGLAALAADEGVSVERLLGDARLFVHGTTIATNVVIQRSGLPVGLLCTHGFRDVLYFRDGFKRDRFNLHVPRSPEFVPRHLRIGVPERTLSSGEVLLALDEDAVRVAAGRFREAGVAAVAVAFLWSVANDAHERRAAVILAEELPGAHILCSTDILPEIREWERTSATALSAYVLPMIADYLGALECDLAASGLASDLLVMQINGGCARVADVLKRPVSVLASGPAAAPAAALYNTSELATDDIITIDMGGTSFDVCVIRAGRAAISREVRVDDQPVGIPAVEVHSVGAGGGSIAWVDDGGALRVGPRSAGAEPGPACYGLGGAAPTVTDANVVLGYLAPEAFLGGRRTLLVEAAEATLQDAVAGPLSLSLEQAAAGVLRVVDSNMVNAIREVSVQRGIDPRRFVLVAGGGAGGLHAARLARALGISQVLIPREAGTLCAFGMAVTDIRHDYVAPGHQISSELDVEAVVEALGALERGARADLQGQGFSQADTTIEYWADARYPGQLFEITIKLPVPVASPEYAGEIESAFHREHARLYTFHQDLPVEVLHWRVTAIGRGGTPAGSLSWSADEDSAVSRSAQSRRAFFDGLGWQETQVREATTLVAGTEIDGPVVIESATTTILVPPGDLLTVAGSGNLVISLSGSNGGAQRRPEDVGAGPVLERTP